MSAYRLFFIIIAVLGGGLFTLRIVQVARTDFYAFSSQTVDVDH